MAIWFRASSLGVIFGAALALSACNPVHNWRDISLASSSATLILPCRKPSRRTQEVPLGGHPVELEVAGCESSGKTFAIMAARLPAGQPPDEVLDGWQRATLENMHADPDTVERQPFQPVGALELAHAQRVLAQGQDERGQSVQAQAAWGAHALPSGETELLHAVVYAKRPMTHEIDVFFENLRWPRF